MNRGRFDSIKINLFWQFAYQITNLALGIILPYFVIRTYGSEVNGLTSTVKQVILLVTLAKAGISTSVTYALYKPVFEHDNFQIARILQKVRQVFRTVGIVTFVVGIGASYVLSFVDSNTISRTYLFLACALTCINTATDLAFTAVYNVFFTATQEKHIISKGLLIYTITTYGLEFFIIINRLDFILLYFSAVVACVVKVIYLEIMFKKHYRPYAVTKGVEINPSGYSEKENAFSNVGYATLNEIAHTVVVASQTIIITSVCGLSYSSIFSIYLMVINALTLVAQVFYTSFAPSFGSVVAEGDINKINRAFDLFQFPYTMLVAIMYMCASVLIIPFVSIYTNNISDLNYVNPILGIEVIIYGIFYSLRVPYNIVVSTTGNFKPSGIQTGITAIISIIISILLARVDYTYVIMGPIIFYLANTFYQHFMLKNRIKGFDNSRFIRHIITLFLGVSIVLVMSCIVGAQPKNYFQWIIYAAITGLVSFVVLAILMLAIDKDSLTETINYFRTRFRKV